MAFIETISCSMIKNDLTNKYTGEVVSTNFWSPEELNKDNSCIHFKKRLFAKKRDKRFCIDCKNRHVADWYID